MIQASLRTVRACVLAYAVIAATSSAGCLAGENDGEASDGDSKGLDDCPAGSHIIEGTSEDDTLTGTEGDDCMVGLGGNDVLVGLGGNDLLIGGEGDDLLEGGEGNDRLAGGSGDDQLVGGADEDALDGGEGDDLLDGGDGNDILRGGSGSDELRGGAGNDVLAGDSGHDVIDGGDGLDVIDNGDGSDTVVDGDEQSLGDDCESDEDCGDGGSCEPTTRICVRCLADAACESTACALGSCSPLEGCVVSLLPDGSSCADDNRCDGDEVCRAGSCEPSDTTADADGDGVDACLDCDDTDPASSVGDVGQCDQPPLPPSTALHVEGDDLLVAGLDQVITCADEGPASDPDGDEVTWVTRFSLNGVALPAMPSASFAQITLPLLHETLGLGTLPTKGDIVECAMQAHAATLASDWVTSAPQIAKGLPPVVGSVLVDAVRAGEAMHCEAVVDEADGDAVELSYAWTRIGTASGLDATLEVDTQDLPAGLVPRGDEVVCTVTATDSDGSHTLASAPAQVENNPPIFTEASISWPVDTTIGVNADERFILQTGATAGVTLTCQGAGYFDADGDEHESTTFHWYVDGALVKSETTEADATSALADVFAKHQTVRCEAVPNDGRDDGTPAADEITIENQIPVCKPNLPTFGTDGTKDVTCGCQDGGDFDGDTVSQSCRFYAWQTEELWRDDGDCTIPAEDLILGTSFTCEITVTDEEGAQNVYWAPSGRVKVDGPIYENTWTGLDPVELVPGGPVELLERDTLLTCEYRRVATTTAPFAQRYYVSWYVDGGETGGYYSPTLAGLDQVSLGELIDAAAAQGKYAEIGSKIACRVSVLGADDSAPRSEPSNEIELIATPGALDQLVASSATYVYLGDTFTCSQTMHDDGSGAQPIATVIEATADTTASEGWYELVRSEAQGVSGSAEIEIGQAHAGLWLRCRAEADRGAGLVTVGTTSATRVITHTPEVTVALRPELSSPCDPRVCDVTVSDPDAVEGVTLRSDLTVRWLVDDEVVASKSSTLSVGVDGAALTYVMPRVTLPEDAVVRCEATAVWRDSDAIAAVTEAAEGRISGVLPSIASASVPLEVVEGDVVTCGVEGFTPGCDADAELVYTFTLDGETVQQSTASTFDTSGVDAAQALSCSVYTRSRYVKGSPVGAAAAADVRPNLWVLDGFESKAHAGFSVAVIGDVSGDGLAELAIGAPNAAPSDATSAGKLYIALGRDSGGTSSLEDIEAGEGGFALLGDSGGWDPLTSICYVPTVWTLSIGCFPQQAGYTWDGDNTSAVGDGLGLRVAAPGDMDGDGLADLLVSAPYAATSGNYLAGRTFMVPGAFLSDAQTQSIGNTLANGGFQIDGAHGVFPSLLYPDDDLTYDVNWNGELAGFGLATGDFDGDGRPDVAVGAPNSGEGDTGRGFFVYTQSEQGAVFLGTIESGDSLDGAVFDVGGSFSVLKPGTTGQLDGLGDFDGDGHDDLFVGGLNLRSTDYIVYGKARPEAPAFGPIQNARDFVQLDSNEDPERVRAVNSSFESSLTGGGLLALITGGRTTFLSSGHGAGDVNGDGIDDLVIPWGEEECGVACQAGEAGGTQIEIAIYFGGPRVQGGLDVDGPDAGEGGFVVEGVPAGVDDVWAMYAAGAGDVNGDGLDDVAVALDKRIYVVFGRTDTASATFADLEAGVGGLMIEHDRSITTLTGGDVDGDGLSDIVFGGSDGVGQAGVWFGRDRGGITHRGLSADETFTGSSARDVMIAGRGDDVLVGNGGDDVLYGGAGDDVLAIADDGFARVDGGAGDDVLRVETTALDLRACVGRVRGIEALDLRAAAANVYLDLWSAARLSTLSNDVRVYGGADDTLHIVEGGWLDVGLIDEGGEPLRVFESGAVRVLLDPAIELMVAPTITDDAIVAPEDATDFVGELVASTTDGSTAVFSADFGAWSDALAMEQDGTVRLRQGSLDFETAPVIHFTAVAQDAHGLSTTVEVTLFVEDVPEPPLFDGSGLAEVQEGAALGTVVYASLPRDEDAEDQVSVSIASGNEDGAFAVDPVTGVVTVADGGALDLESTPVRSLVLAAVDLAGHETLHDVEVTLIDSSVILQNRTLLFVSYDDSLLDNLYSRQLIDDLAFTGMEDLTATTEKGDIAVRNPSGDNIDIDYSSSGTVGLDFSIDISGGFFNAALPVDVILVLPENVEPGAGMTVRHGWALADEAAMSTQTVGVDAALKIHFADIMTKFAVDDEEVTSNQIPLYSPDGVGPEFHLPGQVLTGRKIDVLAPDGVDTTATCYQDDSSLSTRECFEQWFESPLNYYDDDLFSRMFPESEGATNYSNPNILISEGAMADPFEITLDQHQLAADAGLPVDSLWWGEVTFPMGSFGRSVFRYDFWSSIFYYDLDFYTVHALEVHDVVATLAFEDGSTVELTLHSADENGVSEVSNVPVPAGADADGDGRVEISIEYAIDAEGVQAMLVSHDIEWRSTLLMLKYDQYMWTYDPPNPEPVDLELADTIQFGPVRRSATTLQNDDLYLDRWTIEGFNTPSTSVTLQVTTQ